MYYPRATSHSLNPKEAVLVASSAGGVHWCVLELLGTMFLMAGLMPTALPTKPGWPMPSLLTTAVCGT